VPRRFSVSALLSRIRTVTDTENDDHITAAFLKEQLSTIYGALFGAVCETGLRYFETRTPLVGLGALITNGTNVLAEPADQFSHVGLDYIDPAGPRRELVEVMAQERTFVAQPWATGTRSRYFELVEDQYLLYPTPPTGQTYQLLYIPQPPDLSAAADALEVDVVTPDGEAFLTYGVGALVLARKDQDTRFMQAEREAARERLSTWAAMRAFHQTRRQVVESDEWSGGPQPGSWWWSP
jgi:hypothetical protein